MAGIAGSGVLRYGGILLVLLILASTFVTAREHDVGKLSIPQIEEYLQVRRGASVAGDIIQERKNLTRHLY